MHKEKIVKLLREEGMDDLADKIERGEATVHDGKDGLNEEVTLKDSYSATVTRAPGNKSEN